MAIGIDTSKWKPRKIKGTPAAKLRNIVGISILTVGIICGAFYQFSSITAKFRNTLEVFYEDPIEEVERRQMIAAGLIRSGSTIRKIVEQDSLPNQPYK